MAAVVTIKWEKKVYGCDRMNIICKRKKKGKLRNERVDKYNKGLGSNGVTY